MTHRSMDGISQQIDLLKRNEDMIFIIERQNMKDIEHLQC